MTSTADVGVFCPPRSARVILTCHAAFALLMTWVPPLFPVHQAALRTPLWLFTALAASGCVALVTARPRAPRALVLAIGWAQLLSTLTLAIPVGDVWALFASWFSTAALALLAGQLRRGPRKALLAAHVISSGTWVGIAVVFVALSTVALTSHDLETVTATYELMERFDETLLPWANYAATLTGIAIGLGSKWGVFLYWWVAAKLGVSVTILVMAFGFLHDAVGTALAETEELAAAGGTAAQLGGNGQVVLWGFVTALTSLLGAMLLSMYKPGGRTPRGRRLAARRPARGRVPRPVRASATAAAAGS